MRRRLAAVGLGLGLGLTLTACGNKSLDANKLEGQIRSRVKAGGVTLTRLNCPGGREVKRGDRFQCRGQASNGVPITVAVVQTSSGGNVSWNVTRGLLDVTEIEQAIQTEAPGEVTVDCQSPDLVAARDGDALTCVATTESEPKQSTTYKVTANSNAPNGEGFEFQTA